MNHPRWLLLTFFLLLFALIRNVSADTPRDVNRAALVVDYGLGITDTLCVEFTENSISGLELLQRSGLTIVNSGGSICGIEDTGCPATNCFCACSSIDSCIYWSYWLHVDGHWLYSSVGAEQASVVNGDLQGWVWGEGGAGNAPEPPNVTFDTICSQPAYYLFLPLVTR